ncbi:MAG TPA: Crp/Fnr family transcriptional regulator [Halanaerobiaceae bacterium]|nr:Crp/Fnr family transcriptional regulator [Bacillota bacterium]HHU92316.1 Crp/Fnr family transcriptional regulator [Halanaerobiaceae bacterium]HOA41477.1 Crp/Fnr family transcriptional regulator [Halanaerobiales bacterium]HPZ62283.1 Crp/Fnr family transcriptional regulator [Halanaerobiales bacterium]HQD03561.1 Crp/Fnr family transcriptional regulator [Halanaerobiales bacterium]
MSSEDIKYLKNYTLFSRMDLKHLEEISELLESRSFPGGTTIFMEGEKGENVYFLKNGRVKALKSNAEGEEQILEILEAGDVFGEVVLFGIEEYPATTIAMEDVELLFLSRSKFKDYYYQNPEIGWGMLHEMAIKLRNAQSKIKNLGLRDTKGRVATLLLELYHKFGDKNKEFTLELNRQEMASILGTTRETVSRTLSEFKNEGIIDLVGNKVMIKDLEGLQRWR